MNITTPSPALDNSKAVIPGIIESTEGVSKKRKLNHNNSINNTNTTPTSAAVKHVVPSIVVQSGIKAEKPNSIRKYERKTKRFTWPEELHRMFVASIFEVGLKTATPKTVRALMESYADDAGITKEHLKSHLQKYRLNAERSKKEFLQFYDQSIKEALERSQKSDRESSVSALSMSTFPVCTSKLEEPISSSTNTPPERPRIQLLHPRQPHRTLPTQSLQIVQHNNNIGSGAAQYPVEAVPVAPASLVTAGGTNNCISGYSSIPNSTAATAGINSHYHPNTASQVAMQMANQMNIHRQMLQKKIEVEQRATPELPSHMLEHKQQPYVMSSDVHSSTTTINHLPETNDIVVGHDALLPSISNKSAEVPYPFFNNRSSTGEVTTTTTSGDVTTTAAADSIDNLLELDGWDQFGLDVDLPDDDIFSFLK